METLYAVHSAKLYVDISTSSRSPIATATNIHIETMQYKSPVRAHPAGRVEHPFENGARESLQVAHWIRAGVDRAQHAARYLAANESRSHARLVPAVDQIKALQARHGAMSAMRLTEQNNAVKAWCGALQNVRVQHVQQFDALKAQHNALQSQHKRLSRGDAGTNVHH